MKTEERFNYRIIKLAYACPLCMQNPHCPLKAVRKKQFNDKVAWFNSLSLLTKQTIYDYHVQCYQKHTEKDQETCPIASPENAYSNKEERLVAEKKNTILTPHSSKFLPFLRGKTKKLCKVQEYMFGAILCGESHTKGRCSHQYVIGGNTFCSSPARKEIYAKYHL
jgi:hypothetical protein